MTNRFFPPGTPDFLNFDSTATTPQDAHTHNRGARSPAARPRFAPPDRVIIPFPQGEGGSLWDYVTIDGTQFPGLASVSGQGVSIKLDSRSAPGMDGARLKRKGYEPGKFDIKFVVWTEEQFAALETLIPQLHPRGTSAGDAALPIYHPALALLLVNLVVVERISPLVPGSVKDTYEFTVSVVEYAPPTSVGTRVVRQDTSIAVDTAFPPPTTFPSTALPPSATNSNP